MDRSEKTVCLWDEGRSRLNHDCDGIVKIFTKVFQFSVFRVIMTAIQIGWPAEMYKQARGAIRMTFKGCSWCGYIYPVAPGQSACPYCGCKNSHPKKDETEEKEEKKSA